MKSNKPYSGTQAISRAIAVLKTFSDSRPEWNLSDLARELDLNKTTAYRLLSILESEGMVTRRYNGDGYRLGPEVIAMGGRALRSNDLRSASHDELEALAQAVGETASLEILAGAEVLILEEVLGNHLVASWQSVGTRHPAHATSTGKVLLADLSPEERAAILREPLARMTERTITDLAELERQLSLVRQQGYATAIEELEPAFAAASAPVRNHDGRTVAAISIGGPISRLNVETLPDTAGLVKQTADRVSSRLGFR